MKYGICNLSNIPLRESPDDSSEMVSQILFGDHYKVIQENKYWLKVNIAFDNCEGWISIEQYTTISKEYFEKLSKDKHISSYELVDFAEDTKGNLLAIVLGSRLPYYQKKQFDLIDEKWSFEGRVTAKILSKEELIRSAFMYLSSPYLWGGKTPFGIDSSGFTQMVYKLNGYKLLRKASEQATQGEVLSFIEESEPGDLAFFDDNEGQIIHVGIILANNHIIHSSGKVRIDRLDHSGIYNTDLKKHTYKLRVIKKIF